VNHVRFIQNYVTATGSNAPIFVVIISQINFYFMKNLSRCVMMAALLLSTVPASLTAATVSTTPASATAAIVAPIDTVALLARLEEINAMDKSALSGQEKRALRKEVRATKSQLDSNGGIYISTGAVLIIILLLILIF
jgi:AmiR/NasT family two-component response regulator